MQKFVFCLLFLQALSAMADRLPISANVGLSSDYTFRGISQTDENVAIQGGFDYTHSSGFYLGVFGSNVDFNDPDASIEIDGYGGFKHSFLDHYGIDAGVIHYAYPNANDAYSYNEYYMGGNYRNFSLKAYYSDDFFANSGEAVYIDSKGDFSLPYHFMLGLHYGYQWIENNAKFGTPDYADWRIGINREFIGVNVGVAYVDTNLDKNECFSGSSLCSSRAVVSISKVFE
jgi:uncharacterized protein (TIGR02001 family)